MFFCSDSSRKKKHIPIVPAPVASPCAGESEAALARAASLDGQEFGVELALAHLARGEVAAFAGDWARADPIWAQKFDNQPISGGVEVVENVLLLHLGASIVPTVHCSTAK